MQSKHAAKTEDLAVSPAEQVFNQLATYSS
jgi:hypothetical protein